MKKSVLSLWLVFGLFMLGLSSLVFWLIRPETHRHRLESGLGDFFDASARIGRLKWVWVRRSPGLELESLILASHPPQPSTEFGSGTEERTTEESLTVGKVQLELDPGKIFQKEFRVRSIALENPKIRLVRTAAGWKAAGLELPPPGLRKKSPGWGRFAWSVDAIRVQNGFLTYRGETAGTMRSFGLGAVDFRSRSAGNGPKERIEFEGKLGFLTPVPNARLKGYWQRLETRGWTAGLESLRLGLEKITIQKLEEAFPETAALGLRGKLVGAISGSIDKIQSDGERIRDWSGKIHLEGLKLFIRAFKSPFQDLNADIFYDRDTVVISSFDGRIAGGDFIGKTEVKNLNKPDPDAEFKFRAERVVLANLLPRPSEGRPQLDGRISMEIAGKLQGRQKTEWTRSLEAKGSAALADGSLANINVLRLIFDKLAASLPGAGEAFANTLPPELGQKLGRSDTWLAPVQINFFIGNGGVVYPNFRIVGDGFEIQGSGQQGFGGDIEFRTTLILDAAVSSYLLYACPDTAAIADPYGRLSLPLRLTGSIRNIRVIPDTQYIIQRIVSLKGSSYLFNALKKGS